MLSLPHRLTILVPGTRQIFETRSGLVIGTTRSLANSALYEETLKADYRGLITVHWGYRLRDIDFLQRSLVFEHEKKKVEVDGSRARVRALRLRHLDYFQMGLIAS